MTKTERDKKARLFQRAADQRFTAAEFLLENSCHRIEAIYLAGYSIECALKALILRRTAVADGNVMLDKLIAAGAKGHDFEYLKHLLLKKRWRNDTHLAWRWHSDPSRLRPGGLIDDQAPTDG